MYIYLMLIGQRRTWTFASALFAKVSYTADRSSRQEAYQRVDIQACLSKSGYTFLEPFVESSDEEESESEEEEAPPVVIIAESSEFLLDDYMPLSKGIYVDMNSDLVEAQEDVVAYGQEEEFLFDQDA